MTFVTEFFSSKSKPDKDRQTRWQKFQSIIKKFESDLSKYEIKAISSAVAASAKFDSRHPAINIALKGLADQINQK